MLLLSGHLRLIEDAACRPISNCKCVLGSQRVLCQVLGVGQGVGHNVSGSFKGRRMKAEARGNEDVSVCSWRSVLTLPAWRNCFALPVGVFI